MTERSLDLSDDAAAERRRRLMSALADGEGTAAELDQGLAAWQHDDQARADWHQWQLIGDVMRSSDLAGPAARDAALLQAVRARLAQEPVVLAPARLAPEPAQPVSVPMQASTGGRLGGWARAHLQAPAAMAAGFLIVVGGLTVWRGPAGVVDALQARGGAPAASTALASLPVAPSTGPASTPATVLATADGRSLAPGATPAPAELAPYLKAHRQSAPGATAFAMPDPGVRNAAWVQGAP